METLNKHELKIETLDKFMKELITESNSLTKKRIYEKYEHIIKDIMPLDMFYLDMYKQSSTYSIEDIKENANKFMNIFHTGLSRFSKETYSHIFFDSLIEESDAIEKHLGSMKKLFLKKRIKENKVELIKGFETCLQFEKKFVKLENILFPNLENTIPSTMPLQVLWTLHDDARMMIKTILTELRKDIINEEELLILIGEYYYLIYGINQKIEYIIIPVSELLLSVEVLNKMFGETFEYGYALIDIQPSEKYLVDDEYNLFSGEFKTKTGSLSLKEIDLIFSYLPLDITFVDYDDKVKYFNNRKERHFPRNPSVIGRLVKHCHPPKSVATVERIVESFKSGEKDFADFWITFNKVSLYITYYAVRDSEDNYLGILEMSQDITKIKELTGEKRLLDWE